MRVRHCNLSAMYTYTQVSRICIVGVDVAGRTAFNDRMDAIIGAPMTVGYEDVKALEAGALAYLSGSGHRSLWLAELACQIEHLRSSVSLLGLVAGG